MSLIDQVLSERYTDKQIVSSVDNNRPTKTVTFDGGIYSVGSDVVDGQVSVTVKGNTRTNIIPTDSSDWEQGAISTADGTNFSSANVIRTKIGVFYSIQSAVQMAKNISSIFNLAIIGYDASDVFVETIGFTTATFTFNANTKKVRYRISRVDGTATVPSDVVTAKPIVEIGSTVGNFITGTKSTLSHVIESVGKNLFDKNRFSKVGAYFNGGASDNTTDSSLYNISSYIRVDPNTVYTKTNLLAWGYFYDINKTLISGTTTNPFTTPNNTMYFRVGIEVSKLDTAQLEQGTTATTYEPYKKTSTTLPAGIVLRSLPNGVKDEYSATKKAQKVSNTYIVKSTDILSINIASFTYIDLITMSINSLPGISNPSTSDLIGTKLMTNISSPRNGVSQDSVANHWKHWVRGDLNYWYIAVPKGTYADLATAQTAIAGTTLNYQLATPIETKLPVQPLKVYPNGTIYVTPIGDPTQSTLPTVTTTMPIGSPNKFGVASRDYQAATADWTLNTEEQKCFLLKVTNAGGSANIIAPNTSGLMYTINNTSGQTITIKKSGGTGVAILNTKTVTVMHDGTDYIKISES